MTERTEQKPGKPEVSKDPVGTIDTINKGIKWINSKPGRRIVGMGVGVGLGLSAALAGCGKSGKSTATESLPSTTSITQPVTTSESTTTTLKSTTTTENLTTTTTEKPDIESTRDALKKLGMRPDAYDALLSQTTFEEAKKHTEIPKTIIPSKIDLASVPASAQAEFKKQHPKYEITFYGTNNRKTDDGKDLFNDIVYNMPIAYTFAPDQKFTVNFIGGLINPRATGGAQEGMGEFNGLVPIPNSPDCLLELKMPGTNTLFYYRLNVKVGARLDIADLSKELQLFYQTKDPSESPYKTQNFLKVHTMDEFLHKGDMVYVDVEVSSAGGQNSHQDVVYKDENGFEQLVHVTTSLDTGVDNLRASLFPGATPFTGN